MNPQGTYPLPNQADTKKTAILVLAVLLILSLVFGGWAYKSRQDYKNQAYAKTVQAADATNKQKAAQTMLDQDLKQPYKTYKGSATFGTISFNYPKNWAAYVDESGDSEPINGFFHPNQVPGIQTNTAFALRLELVTTTYSDVLNDFSSGIKSGSVKASAYVPPKLNGVANIQPGTKLDGAIDSNNKFTGSMVVMKVRDKTLKIYTESNDFNADFNGIILSSLTFAP